MGFFILFFLGGVAFSFCFLFSFCFGFCFGFVLFVSMPAGAVASPRGGFGSCSTPAFGAECRALSVFSLGSVQGVGPVPPPHALKKEKSRTFGLSVGSVVPMGRSQVAARAGKRFGFTARGSSRETLIRSTRTPQRRREHPSPRGCRTPHPRQGFENLKSVSDK